MVGDVIVLVVLVATLWQAGGAVSLFLDDFVEFDKYKTQISILILRRGALSKMNLSEFWITLLIVNTSKKL